MLGFTSTCRSGFTFFCRTSIIQIQVSTLLGPVPRWDRYPAGTSPGPADLVLQAVSPPLQVHLLGVGVVEAALTQLAVEADDLALVVADLEEAPAG